MSTSEAGTLLRIFIGESENYQGKPTYEQIVLKAKDFGLAGATVIRGIMGFGAQSHMHTAKVLRLSENLPIIIEIVDSAENLDKIMPFLSDAVEDGLVTLEDIKVIKFQ